MADFENSHSTYLIETLRGNLTVSEQIEDPILIKLADEIRSIADDITLYFDQNCSNKKAPPNIVLISDELLSDFSEVNSGLISKKANHTAFYLGDSTILINITRILSDFGLQEHQINRLNEKLSDEDQLTLLGPDGKLFLKLRLAIDFLDHYAIKLDASNGIRSLFSFKWASSIKSKVFHRKNIGIVTSFERATEKGARPNLDNAISHKDFYQTNLLKILGLNLILPSVCSDTELMTISTAVLTRIDGNPNFNLYKPDEFSEEMNRNGININDIIEFLNSENPLANMLRVNAFEQVDKVSLIQTFARSILNPNKNDSILKAYLIASTGKINNVSLEALFQFISATRDTEG